MEGLALQRSRDRRRCAKAVVPFAPSSVSRDLGESRTEMDALADLLQRGACAPSKRLRCSLRVLEVMHSRIFAFDRGNMLLHVDEAGVGTAASARSLLWPRVQEMGLEGLLASADRAFIHSSSNRWFCTSCSAAAPPHTVLLSLTQHDRLKQPWETPHAYRSHLRFPIFSHIKCVTAVCVSSHRNKYRTMLTIITMGH